MTALIQTKFQRPVLGPDLLPRTQLIDRLENGRYRKLTLISAPAGYGKSTLASAWLEVCHCPSAWLTLDKQDSDLSVFLSYVIGAVRSIFPNAFPELGASLAGVELPGRDFLARQLVNEATMLPESFILALDDYHLVQNQGIHQLIDTFIQYQPAQMHLVLITRQDPALDTVKLRAQDQVTEIRLADLRFSEAESQQYIHARLGARLSPDLVQRLFQRTEGWAVGLRLAALALRNQADQARLLDAFQGTNQYITSYLVSEVLSQQPEAVQRFLIQTSLLDRFCAPLCDALLGSESAGFAGGNRAILKRLDQENLFLIPLDRQAHWFRYHHLFQELLRYQLATAVTEAEITRLHQRASAWFAEQGLYEEALEHACQVNDMPRAADILEQARYHLMNNTQWQRLEHLFGRFPHDVVDRFPGLLMTRAWLFYHHGQNSRITAVLDQLEELMSATSAAAGETRHLQGEANALRSLLLYYAADMAGTARHAQWALKQAAPELWIVRTLARLTLAGALQAAGNVSDAYATIYSGLEQETVHSDAMKATTLVTLCYLDWLTADLPGLQRHAAEVVRLSQHARSQAMLGYGHYHLGQAAYLRGDLDSAEEHFAFVTQRPHAVYGDCYTYSTCGLALTYQARGRQKEARAVVAAALTFLLEGGNLYLLRIMEAFQAELALRQGRLSTAVKWADQLEPQPLTPQAHFYAPPLTLVKVWLAENAPTRRQQAANLLAELQAFLESIHNTIALIETLALQAMYLQLEGDGDGALSVLERALRLAMPGGIVRPFVDLGPAMHDLVRTLPATGRELAAYREHILAGVAAPANAAVALRQGRSGDPSPIEPLTDREMDVLILLGRRQTDREIAQELHISPHTVRSHTKNIYSKLAVNGRRQAAARARELGLISSK